jgi:hypothetical protein
MWNENLIQDFICENWSNFAIITKIIQVGFTSIYAISAYHH